MHPQLQTVADEFQAAQARLHRLALTAPVSIWTRRPDPTRWSMVECVGHLNLTAEAYLPLLKDALVRALRLGRSMPGRYRRDPIGWLLWRLAGPPVRRRVRTTPSFVPTVGLPLTELLAEFDRLQAAQMSCVLAADGLKLGRIWITSPFDQRVRYNVYSCLTILPRHQHRHIWQAEQVWSSLCIERSLG